jgi:uncharacterized membrane protein YhfC
MVVLVALTIGLIWWVTAWAFDIKSFDAFLGTVAITVGAAAFVMVKPFIDQLMRRRPASADDPGAAVQS